MKEKDWTRNPQEARQDIEHISNTEIELAEQQAESFMTQNTELGIKAYTSLLKLYPRHERVPVWNEKKLAAEAANKKTP